MFAKLEAERGRRSTMHILGWKVNLCESLKHTPVGVGNLRSKMIPIFALEKEVFLMVTKDASFSTEKSALEETRKNFDGQRVRKSYIKPSFFF